MLRVCKGLIVYARPSFSGVCCFLLSVYYGGTFRTVFGSSGTGHKVCTADLAATGPFGTEDRVLQFRLQRQDAAPEVLADQGSAAVAVAAGDRPLPPLLAETGSNRLYHSLCPAGIGKRRIYRADHFVCGCRAEPTVCAVERNNKK